MHGIRARPMQKLYEKGSGALVDVSVEPNIRIPPLYVNACMRCVLMKVTATLLCMHTKNPYDVRSYLVFTTSDCLSSITRFGRASVVGPVIYGGTCSDRFQSFPMF